MTIYSLRNLCPRINRLALQKSNAKYQVITNAVKQVKVKGKGKVIPVL